MTRCSRCRVWVTEHGPTCTRCLEAKKQYREQNREWLAYRQRLYRLQQPAQLQAIDQGLKTHLDRLHERRTVDELERILSDALANLPHNIQSL